MTRNSDWLTSGALNPAQSALLSPYDQALSRYGRSTPEVSDGLLQAR